MTDGKDIKDGKGLGGKAPCIESLREEYRLAVRARLHDILADEWVLAGENVREYKILLKSDPPSAGKIAAVPRRDGRDAISFGIACAIREVPWMLATLERLMGLVDPDGPTYSIREDIAIQDAFAGWKEKLEKIKGGAA